MWHILFGNHECYTSTFELIFGLSELDCTFQDPKKNRDKRVKSVSTIALWKNTDITHGEVWGFAAIFSLHCGGTQTFVLQFNWVLYKYFLNAELKLNLCGVQLVILDHRCSWQRHEQHQQQSPQIIRCFASNLTRDEFRPWCHIYIFICSIYKCEIKKLKSATLMLTFIKKCHRQADE